MDKLVFITSCFYEPNVTAVIKKLSERNVSWFRFNTETFPLITRIDLHCSSQDEMYAILSDGDTTVDTRQITSSWYRRFGDFLLNDGLSGYEESFVRSECLALVQSVCSHLNCFWVNPRSNELRANVKVYQLQVAKDTGLRVPRTLVTNQAAEVHSFIESNDGHTLFKPVAGAAAGGKPPQFTEEMRKTYSGQFALPPATPDGNFIRGSMLYSHKFSRLNI